MQAPTDPHLCFISLQGEHARHLHQHLLHELRNTIFLCPILGEELPPRNHLVTLLMARYGGLRSNWQLTEYNEGYLFNTPDWLLPGEPIYDSDFWEVHHALMEVHHLSSVPGTHLKAYYRY